MDDILMRPSIENRSRAGTYGAPADCRVRLRRPQFFAEDRSFIRFLSAVRRRNRRIARRTSWQISTLVEGHRFGRLPFLVLSLALGAILAFSLLYQTACEVSMDGKSSASTRASRTLRRSSAGLRPGQAPSSVMTTSSKFPPPISRWSSPRAISSRPPRLKQISSAVSAK